MLHNIRVVDMRCRRSLCVVAPVSAIYQNTLSLLTLKFPVGVDDENTICYGLAGRVFGAAIIEQ